MVKATIESRVIIDCEAHNRFLPNRATHIGTLGSQATSNVERFTDDEDGSEDGSEDSYSDLVSEDGGSTPDSSLSGNSKPKNRPLTDKERLLAVPYVRGYAMKAKTWFWLFVDQISPIQFSENAFQSLVLPASPKKLIKACVDTQRNYKNMFDDIIAGKGRGLIMLLSGP
jgi:hypothetical protein